VSITGVICWCVVSAVRVRLKLRPTVDWQQCNSDIVTAMLLSKQSIILDTS